MFQNVREICVTLQHRINLCSWWDAVEDIASKLLDTFNGNPDEDWWSRIITQKRLTQNFINRKFLIFVLSL